MKEIPTPALFLPPVRGDGDGLEDAEAGCVG
jgi:hypothetical protein